VCACDLLIFLRGAETHHFHAGAHRLGVLREFRLQTLKQRHGVGGPAGEAADDAVLELAHLERQQRGGRVGDGGGPRAGHGGGPRAGQGDARCGGDARAAARTFLALGLITCEPRETWPSPMMNYGRDIAGCELHAQAEC